VSYPLYPADPAGDPAAPFRNLDPAPTGPTMTIDDVPPDPWNDPADDRAITPEELVARQREAFGGPKIGSAFFGWLVAAATAANLGVLVAIAGEVLGLGVTPDPWETDGVGPLDAPTVGWIGAGVLLAIVLVSFYCGGYVAGRMARFSGVAQGIAVWVWAVAASVAVAVTGTLLDDRYDVFATGTAVLPRVPVTEDVLTFSVIAAVVAVAVVSAGGAILGGIVGVRYHRRVDRVALEG
jgi:hypothetical protein